MKKSFSDSAPASLEALINRKAADSIPRATQKLKISVLGQNVEEEDIIVVTKLLSKRF